MLSFDRIPTTVEKLSTTFDAHVTYSHSDFGDSESQSEPPKVLQKRLGRMDNLNGLLDNDKRNRREIKCLAKTVGKFYVTYAGVAKRQPGAVR
jgi:hypothetical protein